MTADSSGEAPVNEFDRYAEVAAILDEDDTVLGSVWRRTREGQSVQEIADEDGTTKAPVYNAVQQNHSLLTGTLTNYPTTARGWAGRIRTWLRIKPMSPELRAALEEQERLLSAVVNDSHASAAEAEEAVQKSKDAEAENVPGIYVYTLPHYVRHPYEPKTGRTLLKVGHSSVDALYRANSQTRVTSLPEDPWLLRIYPVAASSESEKQIHAFLRDADHDGVRGSRSGAEWFLTSLKFLDRVASTLGLEVRVINDFAIDDEQ